MGIRKSSNGNRPEISQVTPVAAITGGEIQIRGKSFALGERPRVKIGDIAAPIVIGSDSLLIVKVPEGASAGELVIQNGQNASQSYTCDIGIMIAENLHPVTNPAVDTFGNIFTTFSGSRGQKVPVAVFRLDLNFNMKPFVTDMMNATGLVFDREGLLYVSSRFDGIVYRVTPNGNMTVFVEGMGVATGLAFDNEDNLYVGDRSGTIFKISPEGQIFVFATSKLPSLPIIWRTDPIATSTSPGRPHRVTTRSTASAMKVKWKCSSAAWAARRAWISTRTAISM
jgi:hypothetical protein